MRRVLLCLVFVLPARGATIGQVDNFEDGTTQGWHINSLGFGGGAGPVNASTGGPAGVNDNYLLLTATGGSGGGSRLTVNHFFSQWAGDYAALGLNSVAMDLSNPGTTDLSIRLMLENPLVGPPTDTATTNAVTLLAGSGWTHVQFDLSAGALTSLSGNVNTLLSNVTGLRIYHNPTAAFPGPSITALLGVDNITAQSVPQPVPEPSTSGGVLAALAAIVLGRGRMSRGLK